MSSAPLFQPGDWVKVVKKPKEACRVLKGDVIKVEQVSPSRKMVRVWNSNLQWETLRFDEIELTLSPKPMLPKRTTEKQGVLSPKVAIESIKWLLDKVAVSHHQDIIQEILSWHNDRASNRQASRRSDKPQIVWRSPAGREDQYPWVEYQHNRAYIGGGSRNSKEAQRRVAFVQGWITEEVSTAEILRRVRAKQFSNEATAEIPFN